MEAALSSVHQFYNNLFQKYRSNDFPGADQPGRCIVQIAAEAATTIIFEMA
jgi:hypothetical protein